MKHAASLVSALAVSVVVVQAQTFKSSTEAVRVDVLVTDDGRPVRDLERQDFEVRDNGVLQTVDIVSFESIPLSIMLALDLSSSVTEEGLGHLRAAGNALLDGLTPADRAGVLTFSHALVRRLQAAQRGGAQCSPGQEFATRRHGSSPA